MISNKKVALLGGDTRQIALAACLCHSGLAVQSFGLPPEKLSGGVRASATWQEALEGAEAVILPLPVSPDGRRLNAPLYTEWEPPLLVDIFSATPKGALVTGGKISPGVKAMAQERGIVLYDYFACEALQQKNALPTAEGAVSILMREVPCTVSGSAVGITGYGRVARALARLLVAMGAEVTVTARKQEQLLQAAQEGCRTLPLEGEQVSKHFLQGKTAIFNTVPYRIFTEAALKYASPSLLLIDLASAPGGVDANGAQAAGVKVIWALSLPGKYAPVTAGEIIAETVLEHMREEGLL